MKTSAKNQSNHSPLIKYLLNDPETKMRIGIKEVEERVKNETKNRKINAPLTIEEKILFSH